MRRSFSPLLCFVFCLPTQSLRLSVFVAHLFTCLSDKFVNSLDGLSLGGPLNINYYSIYGLPNRTQPAHNNVTGPKR